MITPSPCTLIAIISCLQLVLSLKLTPLTIDEHPCKPEKIKFQNRYVCDSQGNIECLTGWQSKSYNMDKHFPCSEPICDPPCQNGVCKLPNVCSCEIGWDGLDCGTCIDMPGCANGNCTNPDTLESEPFKCYCQDGWKGALCDQPSCDEHCNNQGQCVVTVDGGRQCNCNLGWSGPTCANCTASVGCDLEHTLTPEGCQLVEDTPGEPNTCQCTSNWKGTFCEIPKCKDSTVWPVEIECVNGVCTSGGTNSTGDMIPAFCKCNVGWTGEKCDKCEPHPNCPETGIDKCIHPWECLCQGSESEATATNDFKFCTEFIDA